MNYSLDIAQEFKNARSVFLKQSLFFSLLFAAVLLGDFLLVYFAGEEFFINLFIASAITVIFIWVAIYFFSNIYTETNNRYRYFKGYDSGIKPIEEVEFLKKSDELCYINGLYVYPLYVRYSMGLTKQDKVIFTLNKDISYEMGDKLTITTYQRILVEAEKHAWRNLKNKESNPF